MRGPNSLYIKKNKCRACSSPKLYNIFSLGNIAVSRFSKKSEAGQMAPLSLVLCQKCHLLQLEHTVKSQLLFGHDYWYQSGINPRMKKELTQIVRTAEKLTGLKSTDNVLDIGCNDGTLLRSYAKTKNTFGIDPAKNIVPLAKKGTKKIINDFFSYTVLQKEFAGQMYKVITAIAMFYDLDDPNAFLFGVKRLLHPDGVLIIQQNYLPEMLRNNAFDNIVHEHLTYYSLQSLESLLQKHDLEVFDVIQNDINGGSFRTYIKHKNSVRAINKNVVTMKLHEAKLRLYNIKIYKDFHKSVAKNCELVKQFITTKVLKGKSIYVYGASTRGNTILQYCGLDYHLIKKAVERNSIKWGLNTSNTLIPIISEEQARRDKPDYLLVLPWFYKKEIIKREKKLIQSGSKLIFPLPELTIYE